MLKDKSNVNINCSKLARQYGCDRRTVSKAINAVKNNLPPPKANKPRKTDGFELIIQFGDVRLCKNPWNIVVNPPALWYNVSR